MIKTYNEFDILNYQQAESTRDVFRTLLAFVQKYLQSQPYRTEAEVHICLMKKAEEFQK